MEKSAVASCVTPSSSPFLLSSALIRRIEIASLTRRNPPRRFVRVSKPYFRYPPLRETRYFIFFRFRALTRQTFPGKSFQIFLSTRVDRRRLSTVLSIFISRRTHISANVELRQIRYFHLNNFSKSHFFDRALIRLPENVKTIYSFVQRVFVVIASLNLHFPC